MDYRFGKLCLMLGAIAFAALPGLARAASLLVPRGYAPIQSMIAPRSVRKLYVVDNAHNAIDLFPAGVARPKQIGTITQGIASPVDAFVDSLGTLYVANANPATITEYAPGSRVPKLTLSLGGLRPFYVTAGPDGTVYVMGETSAQLWRVYEFDLGSRTPSRIIRIPYSYPYALVGAGIAVNAYNYLFMNSGDPSASGGYAIRVYPPKAIKSVQIFSSGGYASGAVQIYLGECFVGDPNANNIELWDLPVKPKSHMGEFITESSGDYFTLDVASHYLYSVSYSSHTLQIYNFRNGRLLNFLTGFSGGVAVDPVAKGL